MAEHELPARLITMLERLHAHFKYLEQQIAEIDKELASQLGDDDLGQRLMTILVSARSLPACWPPSSVTENTIDVVVISRRQSDWCHASTVLGPGKPEGYQQAWRQKS